MVHNRIIEYSTATLPRAEARLPKMSKKREAKLKFEAVTMTEVIAPSTDPA